MVFVAVAAMVSSVVDLSARRVRIAARARAEAETLSLLSGSVLRGEQALPALVGQLRETFGMTSVALLMRTGDDRRPAMDADRDRAMWTVIAQAGDAPCLAPAEADIWVPVTDDALLALRGRALPAADRRVLTAFAAQMAIALDRRRLAREAEGVKPLAEADRMRTALLNAVSHDLRTPLSSAKVAVSSLRGADVTWTEGERLELLATAEESLDRLIRLVGNLLDMSRLEAGALALRTRPVQLEELVPRVLHDLGPEAARVQARDMSGVPAVLADPGLLERVVENLVLNAIAHGGAGRPPTLAASALGDRVEVRVVDHGAGIDESRRDQMFQPFQRLGDRDNTTGIGLGLALSRGLVEAMRGSLEPEETPGGGLTMVVALPAAAEAAR